LHLLSIAVILGVRHVVPPFAFYFFIYYFNPFNNFSSIDLKMKFPT